MIAIRALAGPIIATQLANTLVAVVVRFWAGRLLGADALAVLAIMGPVSDVVSSVTAGLAGATAVYLGRSIGARDGHGMKWLGHGLVTCTGIGLLLAVVGAVAAGSFVELFARSANIAPTLHDYWLPWLLTLPVLGMTQVIASSAKAAGWPAVALRRSLGMFVLIGLLQPVMIWIGLDIAAIPIATVVSASFLNAITLRALLGNRGGPRTRRVVRAKAPRG